MTCRIKNGSLRAALLGIVGTALGGGMLVAQVGASVPNWTVPPYSARSSSGGITTMGDVSDGSIFVAIDPCRVVDTRGPGGPYGGPPLSANVPRTFDVDSGPCTGIPGGAAAYSLSFGVIVPPTDGFLTAWPSGSPQPTISQMNFLEGKVIANAAIVPAGGTGAIDVLVSTGPTHLYFDINGYFMDSGGVLNTGRQLLWRGNVPGDFMYVVNNDSVTQNATAVRGIMNTTQAGAIGVAGEQSAITGRTYGVFGRNFSNGNGAAGVKGVQGSGEPNGSFTQPPAGLIGTSLLFDGILGITQGGSGGAAVRGARLNAIPATSGELGVANLGGRFFGDVEINGDLDVLSGFSGNGDITKDGTVSFIEPHPTDASKAIRYVSLEGPEAGTYFRGRAKFENGLARIPVPDNFRFVTAEEGLTVQVTPIGAMATVAVMKMDLDEIVIRSSRNVEFSYLVQGVRRTFADYQPIVDAGTRYVRRGEGSRLPDGLPADRKRRLIANGTYNADGTVNAETAKRLGWDRIWAEGGEERPPVETSPE
jgi:hypothetical protein